MEHNIGMVLTQDRPFSGSFLDSILSKDAMAHINERPDRVRRLRLGYGDERNIGGQTASVGAGPSDTISDCRQSGSGGAGHIG
jgi:hypothetical protein